MGRKVEAWIGWGAAGAIGVGIMVSHLLTPIVAKGDQRLAAAPIVVCPTAPRGAALAAERAAAQLRQLGFTVGDVQHGDCGVSCGRTCVPGAIVIDTASPALYLESVHGRCTRPASTPTWGVIELTSEPLSDGDYTLLLAHEIAHCALGYGDVRGPLGLSPPKGHLMNAKLDEIGWSTRGM